MSNLGEKIFRLRTSEGMSLRDLAAKSGVSNPFISQLETGKQRNPSISTLFHLAKGLEISPILLAEAAFEDIA